MKLFYREIGQGSPMIIMHGLYGASDNWMTIAKEFSADFRVILPDLRNHGSSAHDDEFSIAAMTGDLLELFEDLNLKSVIVVGHSLGGKVAMDFATLYPQKVEKLIVVDIAPRNYSKNEFTHRSNHQEIVNTLLNVDLSKYSNRKDALEDIVKIDPTKRLMFFMMKNIKRNENGTLDWKINLKAIADNLTTILNEYSVDLSKIVCPTLFVKGEKSPYLSQKDFDNIATQLKNVRFETILDASHWLHAEKPDEFVAILREFLNSES